MTGRRGSVGHPALSKLTGRDGGGGVYGIMQSDQLRRAGIRGAWKTSDRRPIGLWNDQ